MLIRRPVMQNIRRHDPGLRFRGVRQFGYRGGLGQDQQDPQDLFQQDQIQQDPRLQVPIGEDGIDLDGLQDTRTMYRGGPMQGLDLEQMRLQELQRQKELLELRQSEVEGANEHATLSTSSNTELDEKATEYERQFFDGDQVKHCYDAIHLGGGYAAAKLAELRGPVKSGTTIALSSVRSGLWGGIGEARPDRQLGQQSHEVEDSGRSPADYHVSGTERATAIDVSKSIESMRAVAGLPTIIARIVAVDTERDHTWTVDDAGVRVECVDADGQTRFRYAKRAFGQLGAGPSRKLGKNVVSEDDRTKLEQAGRLKSGEAYLSSRPEQMSTMVLVGDGATALWIAVDAAKRGAVVDMFVQEDPEEKFRSNPPDPTDYEEFKRLKKAGKIRVHKSSVGKITAVMSTDGTAVTGVSGGGVSADCAVEAIGQTNPMGMIRSSSPGKLLKDSSGNIVGIRFGAVDVLGAQAFSLENSSRLDPQAGEELKQAVLHYRSLYKSEASIATTNITLHQYAEQDSGFIEWLSSWFRKTPPSPMDSTQ